MREIVLLTIFGPDKPGVTHSVTAVLATHGGIVLDINQAVIHDTLSLGLVVEFPDVEDTDPLLADLRGACDALDMRFEHTTIDESAYLEWAAHHGKPRYIVTLLARTLTAEHISATTKIIAANQLNIDNISRLSERLSLEHSNPSTKSCIEFSLRGAPQDISALRAAFLAMGNELGIDIAFQRDSAFRRNRRLVAFDMDSTLIEAEVIDELAKRAGVGDQVSAITESAMRGDIDFTESFAQRVALLKGLDESVLKDIAAALPITEGAEVLVRSLKALGYKTAILSGGFTYFARYLQSRLGIDYIHANELEIVDGKVTGVVTGKVVDGARKAELLKDLAAVERLDMEQVIAVGDGANDLPMLGIAGLGIAFRAKPLVKETAEQAISNLGLDSILYLLGVRDRDSHELLHHASQAADKRSDD